MLLKKYNFFKTNIDIKAIQSIVDRKFYSYKSLQQLLAMNIIFIKMNSQSQNGYSYLGLPQGLENNPQTIISNTLVFSPQKLQLQGDINIRESTIRQEQKISNQLQYFNSFFSPKQTADSIQKRNQNLQLLNFQKSEEEPDEIYNRRKRKVFDLLKKQQQQVQEILSIKKEDTAKYYSIINFIKVFCNIKANIASIRTDYYSNKTFSALKNSKENQLELAYQTVKKMYQNVMKAPKILFVQQMTEESSLFQKQRSIQFLIIPRFLISKEKINRLSRDQQLQENFQFLIIHQSLGHYNNEANKKMPEQKQMSFVKELMKKKDGRQKFKKICSINHGSKFLKNQGSAYYQLYSKSLEYLKYLDNELKKGKKYEHIKKNLTKFNMETEDSIPNSQSQNSSNSGFLSFRSFNECLKSIDKDVQSSYSQEQKIHDLKFPVALSSTGSMKKNCLKRYSTMSEKEQQYFIQNNINDPTKKFIVRKSATMQSQKSTKNIILIPPPSIQGFRDSL